MFVPPLCVADGIFHPIVYGTRSSCDLVPVVSFIFAPVTEFMYLWRAFQLWFLYRWHEARLNLNQRGNGECACT